MKYVKNFILFFALISIFETVVIEKEAKDQNKNLFSHWAHMMIHSILHLQNFDHVDDENAKIMETIEIETLELFNIPNPYED